jgi:hypothetical protein
LGNADPRVDAKAAWRVKGFGVPGDAAGRLGRHTAIRGAGRDGHDLAADSG